MKKLNFSKKRIAAFVLCLLVICLSLPAVIAAVTKSQNVDFPAEQTTETDGAGDYTGTKKDITGEKIKLDEPELAEKEWFEYVEYNMTKAIAVKKDGEYTYNIYPPFDYGDASIMAIRDYNADELKGSGAVVGVNWGDMIPMLRNIAFANTAVGLTGGIAAGLYGGLTQGLASAGAVWETMSKSDNLLRECDFYSTPSSMGITGDSAWKGVSNSGFYNCSSLSVKISKSESLSVQKTNSASSVYSVGGEHSISANVDLLFAEASTDLKSSASSDLGYGLDFQQGQNIDRGVEVERTFTRRDDEEVKNVAWKLCEYVVKVPYYVIVEKDTPEGKITVLEEYITNDLLNGVCSVYANGYIEHWNTGKLVTYADFFEGFVTSDELVNSAKEKMQEEANKNEKK